MSQTVKQARELARYPHDHKRREPDGWTRWSVAALAVLVLLLVYGLVGWWDDEGEPGPSPADMALVQAHRGE